MMEMTPTPHNTAAPGDIAQTVLMPGDPLRAKFIAEHFLENPTCFNQVRGMLGYTGTYKGARVSVMGSGMGIPSIAIYAHELYNFYGVENIIRIGSAGGLAPQLEIADTVAAMGACTNSAFASQYGLGGTFAPVASFTLLQKAVCAAEREGISLRVGNVLSSDAFYSEEPDYAKKWQAMGVLAIEMEAAGLYTVAARAGKNALALLTISDCYFKEGSMDAAQRETSLTNMMKIALETAAEIAGK